MKTPHNLYNTLENLPLTSGEQGQFYSLLQLEKSGIGHISRLPFTLRIILEALLRHYDGIVITKDHLKQIANWQPNNRQAIEVPFHVARIILQDYTGVPLLVDLAAMRSTLHRMGYDPKIIEPQVPVSLIIDHSLQTNYTQHANAAMLNMCLEFNRNKERYSFIKWASAAFNNLQIIPPGNGIIHQINLEYLSKGVISKKNIFFPDSVIGTDSHTTMINGLGVVGWGVGGIEAETCVFGHPIHLLIPDIVGVHLIGELGAGVSATDLVLTLTAYLRKANVTGKIVEFYGAGAAALAVSDRATIANMAPEYGATMGYFSVDDKTLEYYRATGRSEHQVEMIAAYFKAQQLFGTPISQQCAYSQVLTFNLNEVQTCVAGPKRPQDLILLYHLKNQFEQLLETPIHNNGYNLSKNVINQSGVKQHIQLTHGDIVLAAITSCANTSNPTVMVAAGILAKKALAKGLRVKPHIKTSMTPGSLVVTEYLKKAGLMESLAELGFNVSGYGCATCNGNVGELLPDVEEILDNNKLIVSAVLSGNRNFESRIHPRISANFLMSPPLVIAFAIAGTVRIDITHEPIGHDQHNNAFYLNDIWPSSAEIAAAIVYALDPGVYQEKYRNIECNSELWNKINAPSSSIFAWDNNSTYIAEPPFFKKVDQRSVTKIANIYHARVIAILGDSITTDHISPAGSIEVNSPAGIFLRDQGVKPADFNSYGARRGHHEIMVRAAFSNAQLKNRMIENQEGNCTVHYPSKKHMTIFDAAELYQQEQVPLILIAGHEYGMGSSRDWAAKGTLMLGVRAVIALSFERIHRSNLIGMGVLPCQFKQLNNIDSLGLRGDELFNIIGLDHPLTVHQELVLVIQYANGNVKKVSMLLQVNSQIELDYVNNGGIHAYSLRKILNSKAF